MVCWHHVEANFNGLEAQTQTKKRKLWLGAKYMPEKRNKEEKVSADLNEKDGINREIAAADKMNEKIIKPGKGKGRVSERKEKAKM